MIVNLTHVILMFFLLMIILVPALLFIVDVYYKKNVPQPVSCSHVQNTQNTPMRTNSNNDQLRPLTQMKMQLNEDNNDNNEKGYPIDNNKKIKFTIKQVDNPSQSYPSYPSYPSYTYPQSIYRSYGYNPGYSYIWDPYLLNNNGRCGCGGNCHRCKNSLPQSTNNNNIYINKIPSNPQPQRIPLNTEPPRMPIMTRPPMQPVMQEPLIPEQKMMENIEENMSGDNDQNMTENVEQKENNDIINESN